MERQPEFLGRPPVELLLVAYATEAGIFQGTGVPTIVCGPGDIAQAHQPNEFILKSQLAACDAFLDRMIEWAGRQ